jgi:hypothetical protein
MRFSFLSSPLPSPSSFLSQAARGSGGILTLKSSGTAAVGRQSKRRDHGIPFPKAFGDQTCQIVGIVRVGISGSRSAAILTRIPLHRRGGLPCGRAMSCGTFQAKNMIDATSSGRPMKFASQGVEGYASSRKARCGAFFQVTERTSTAW